MECSLIASSTVSVILIALVAWWRYTKKEFVDASNAAIFISGCDTGLGNFLVSYLDGLGCTVFAGCLNPSEARSSLPDSVTVVPLDICSEDSVKNAVSEIGRSLEEKRQHLWGLINNAGVCVYGQFEWQTWNQCQRQVDANLLGTMRLTKACLPLLKPKRGRIVTITSVNGSISYPGLSVYSATKFALEGLCHALRLELWQQHGIKVIIIEPGDFARLTSIMSQHQENVREMWDSMPREDQDEIGDFFRMYHRVTLKNYGLTSPRTLEGSPLLMDVRDALFSPNPRIRYISAGIQYRIFYQILGVMPFRIVDTFLDKVTDMLYKSDRQD